MSDDGELVKDLTVERLREIIREEISFLTPPSQLPVLPLPRWPMQRQPMACACGPNQCAMQQMNGIPCTHFRYQP